MRRIIFFLLSSVFIFLFCKTSKVQFTAEEIQSIQAIFEENQKVLDFLLKTETQIPSVVSLREVIQTAQSKATHPELKKIFSNLSTLLQAYSEQDKEKAFTTLSNFSEELDKLAVYAGLIEYHKFFCPMVSKYWVAKGESIHNPYAPDMRECGELVR